MQGEAIDAYINDLYEYARSRKKEGVARRADFKGGAR